MITISTIEGHFFFRPEDIVRLEACDNYTRVFLANQKKILASKVLKEFAQKLEPMGFLRTHRSHLVNTRYITHIDPCGTITMADTSTAEISRSKRREVIAAMRTSI
ncbi:MAG TPA: LytTR family DNA-binding domain-containing protein [Saprospiraceae bacterium]|jgi:two-component system, LytTR family, response regulator